MWPGRSEMCTTSVGNSDQRTTYNTGSCKTGESVVSAAFTSGGQRTYLVLGGHKGRRRCFGSDLWLVVCQDWHDSVNGESKGLSKGKKVEVCGQAWEGRGGGQ